MRQLSLIRLAVLILMRDLLIPGGGLYIAISGIKNKTLEPWHLPLIAGMCGTPLVARGGSAEEELGKDVLNPPGQQPPGPSSPLTTAIETLPGLLPGDEKPPPEDETTP